MRILRLGWKQFIEISWKQHFIELSAPKKSSPVDSLPPGFTDRGVASTPPTGGHRTSLPEEGRQGSERGQPGLRGG